MQFRKQRLIKEIKFHVQNWLRSGCDHVDSSRHVTLTDIVISSDLSNIKLYIHWDKSIVDMSLLSKLRADVFHLRKLIAEKIPFKKVPQLKFYFDDNRDVFNELTSVMASLDIKDTESV